MHRAVTPSATHQRFSVFTGFLRDITARQQAEAALRAAEMIYHSLVETLPQNVFRKDSEGRFTFVNQRFCDTTGRVREEVLGRTDFDLFPDALAAKYRVDDQRVMATRQPYTVVEEHVTPGSGRLFVEVTKSPLMDAAGDVTGVQGIFWDVTARETAAETLRESQAGLDMIFRASPAAISISTVAAGRLIEVNDRYCEFFGYTREELIGQNTPKLNLWANPADRAVMMQRLTVEDSVHDFEARLRRKSGEVRDVLMSMELIDLAGAGEPTLICMFTDITARKQAEATLVREHELLRTVIDNLPGYIFVKDTAGRYLVSNHAHAQLMCGPDETKLLGKTAFDFFPEEAARAFSADDDAVMRTGQPVVDREETDEADGQRRWYQLTKVPLRGEHGQIVGLVGIKHDITAKKELESQFLRSQRMEAIGTLAGGVAHDLNNALAPILMATEFMRSRCNDADTEQLLDTVAACAQRGAGMVRQLLTFARGAEGEHGPVQLTHLIKEMASLARQTFPKNIEARTDYPPDLWTILGNPTQLHQVLLNLCVNARDAMPDGGTLTLAAANVRPADDCAALSPGPHMVLSVTDTGTGMTPEVRARLFEAFFTTKAPGVGTGLGLSTINGIVKEHGGFITVQSEVGRGTEFKVFLPAQTVAAAAPAAAAAASLPQGNGELILVVDDEPSVLNIATRMLTLFGYRVVTAKDGVDAVTAFIRQPDEIQLVITDMDMPTMDGPATIGALRQLAPKLKVIVSSGMSFEHHADALSVLRVKVFLHKPYSVEELLHAVHEVITGEAKATE